MNQGTAGILGGGSPGSFAIRREGILSYRSALSTYRETRVTTAGQGQLIIMLYNEAVKHLDEALQLSDHDGRAEPACIERFGRAVVKAQDVITELMASLDFERGGDISHNLFSLYSWFSRELTEANIGRDAARIAGVRGLMDELRSAWLQIVSSGADASACESVGVSIAG